jgi:tetratricopeptide (TPR) repeat protein
MYFMRAVCYECLNEIDRAIADYTEVIRRDSEHIPAVEKRAKAYFKKNDKSNTFADLDRLVELVPAQAEYYLLRASVCGSFEEYEKALKDTEKAISIDPNNADAYIVRGTTYGSTGNMEKAKTDLIHALKLNPASKNAREVLVMIINIYVQQGTRYNSSKDYPNAINNFTAAIEGASAVSRYNTELATIYYKRGIAYHLSQKYDNAISDLNNACQLDPANRDYKNAFERSKRARG